MECDNKTINPDETISSEVTIKSNRNYCLLLFEIIACIFIIFIHISFPGEFGLFLELFARFGVPLFFVVSGFYMIQPNMDKKSLRRKMKRRLIHISLLLLFSTLLYLLTSIFNNINNLSSFFVGTFSLQNLGYFALFNMPFLSGHNWFLLAMIYSYIIIYLFPNIFLGKNRWLVCISAIMIVTIILHILSFQVDFNILGLEASHYIIYRNWLFNALPFISLGILLKRNEDLFSKLKTPVIIIILFISAVLMVVESYMYINYLHAKIEFDFFNIICVISIIALSSKVPMLFSKSRILNMKGNWPTYVYILHPAIIILVDGVFNSASWSSYAFAPYIKPLIVILVSVLLAILLNWIITLVKIKYISHQQGDL